MLKLQTFTDKFYYNIYVYIYNIYVHSVVNNYKLNHTYKQQKVSFKGLIANDSDLHQGYFPDLHSTDLQNFVGR